MAAVERRLVRPDGQLIQLFDPPFDRGSLQPGYIKGYVPGVRENGGQYTHAAVWTAMAFAAIGDAARAWELFDLINPLHHGNSEAAIAVYKVEPYVVAADVYTAEGQLGRGGWTWYTGSASWMYRVGLENILGFTKRGDKLCIAPRVPRAWDEYAIEYRFGSAVYAITVRRAAGSEQLRVTVDGRETANGEISLADDGRRHEVLVLLSRGDRKN